MLDDQQIRRALIAYADRVAVDAEADLDRVLGGASAQARRSRRVALLVAVPLLVVVAVGAVLVAGDVRGPRADRPAAEVSAGRLTGTWVRSVLAEEELPPETAGVWTMVLAADGSIALVPPEAWTAGHSRPNGIYVRADGFLRTNVFASESCAGAAGEYAFAVARATLDLTASIDPCALRAAVLDGRWERGP